MMNTIKAVVFPRMSKINSSRLANGPVEELSICVPSVEQDLSQSELWIEQSVLANPMSSEQTGTSTGKLQYRDITLYHRNYKCQIPSWLFRPASH